eukprot:522793-Pleurochrysis_carterae.AAC.1
MKDLMSDKFHAKTANRVQKRRINEVNAASEESIHAADTKPTPRNQQNIMAAFDTTNAKTVNVALAELFFGNNLPFALVRTRLSVCRTHATCCSCCTNLRIKPLITSGEIISPVPGGLAAVSQVRVNDEDRTSRLQTANASASRRCMRHKPRTRARAALARMQTGTHAHR